jgi:2'-hydroxyisoflavone reductase
MTTRRQFIQLAAGAIGVHASGLSFASVDAATKPLDILVLGGTGFIGPHEIEYALARGHRVTMFNRGKRNAGMFGKRVETLIGDRDSKVGKGLKVLEGDRTWDVVIDNSGFVPRHVRDSAGILEGRVGRYIFISTVSVYDFEAGVYDFPEDGPLATLTDPAAEDVTWETYGPLKAECERSAQKIFGESATIIRPGYIVGPGDTSDRFTYWAVRVTRGGNVLAPAGPELEVQWVDARDMCPWIIGLGERNIGGVFNVAGPASPLSNEGFLYGLRACTGNAVRFFWPSSELMEKFEITPPMLESGGDSLHFDSAAAINYGLDFRPLADTVIDTVAWWRKLPEERRSKPRAGIAEDKEREVIDRLRDLTQGQGKDA